MIKKNELKDKERVIIHYIHLQGGNTSANQITEATGISYVTVQKYLKRLEQDGIIINPKRKEKKLGSGRNYTNRYFLNYSAIYGQEPTKEKRKRKRRDPIL